MYAVLAELHSLGRRNGRAGLYADDPSDVRRLSHEPHAGGESGTLCGAFCSHGKVHGQDSLWNLYLSLSAGASALLVGKMPMFDALTLTFGTAGTGGFGIKNDSIGSYTTYQQTVITIFMILFGVNFNVYFLFLLKKIRQGLKN